MAVRYVIWLDSWWWPKRSARVPGPGTAWLVAGAGAALFGVSALLLKTGTLSWDERLFRVLNEVPAAAAAVLTPVSHLFLPAGIVVVVVLAVLYIVARNRSVLPVAAGAAAAVLTWALAHVAKAIADRPRPYEVMAGAVLRQQPAHGTSFPSSHTARASRQDCLETAATHVAWLITRRRIVCRAAVVAGQGASAKTQAGQPYELPHRAGRY